MPLESLHGQRETHEEAQRPGAVCWVSLPAALWGMAGLSPLPASFVGHAGGNELKHHYGDTTTPCHSGRWSPAPPGALLRTSQMMSPCVFSQASACSIPGTVRDREAAWPQSCQPKGSRNPLPSLRLQKGSSAGPQEHVLNGPGWEPVSDLCTTEPPLATLHGSACTLPAPSAANPSRTIRDHFPC